jgi:Flp pilus assembly protein TadG
MSKKFFLPFLLCARGATVLEYALILPALLWLLMGIVEYSMVIYSFATLEGSITDAAMQSQPSISGSGNTPSGGYINSGTTEIQYLLGVIKTRTSGLLDPNNITISAYAKSTDGSNSNTATLYSAALINYQPVVYTAHYPWPITTPFLKNVLGSDGIFDLSASAIVLNPPQAPLTR